jgi:hypothetical protein
MLTANLFLDLLGHTIDRFRWRCYAYCLMPNHYHLVVETPEPNLARGMRHLNGVYIPSALTAAMGGWGMCFKDGIKR